MTRGRGRRRWRGRRRRRQNGWAWIVTVQRPRRKEAMIDEEHQGLWPGFEKPRALGGDNALVKEAQSRRI